MRVLMLKEQKSAGIWDIKRTRGGLVEVEFIAQHLQLLHANATPDVLSTNTLEALDRLTGAGHLALSTSQELKAASTLYHRLTQVLRLCAADQFDPEVSPKGLNALVARAAELPDIAASEALLEDTQSRVAAIFDDIIGSPIATESSKPPV
jgi:[glutamine synthetase] adenylyltransferase / [glutamine synthetase]-adenylyl-L-tyrosine phosphorylase